MKIITNIRNKLNEREDEILSQIENTFMSLSPNEKIIKDYEKIPKKINEIIGGGVMLYRYYYFYKICDIPLWYIF